MFPRTDFEFGKNYSLQIEKRRLERRFEKGLGFRFTRILNNHFTRHLIHGPHAIKCKNFRVRKLGFEKWGRYNIAIIKK